MMRYILMSGLVVTQAGCWERPAEVSGAGQPHHGQAPALLVRVADARENGVAPALAATVVSCSNILAAADGRRALDRDTPVSQQDRFNIGSNAKSMLATLVAVLVERGELRWETTVQELYGKDAASFDPGFLGTTVEDLLSHRSGLDAYTSGAQIDGIPVPEGDAHLQRFAFAKAVLSRPPAVTPRSEFLYSNAGYVVVGAALERRLGMPFERLMQVRLFDPLGIAASFGEPGEGADDQPRGHFSRDGDHQVYRALEPVIPVFLQPAGDVAISAEDYGKYLQLHLCGLQEQSTPVLSPETIAFLHAPRGEEKASLGWGRHEFDGWPASIHVGGTGAYSAFVAVVPGRNLAVATMVNSGDAEARSAALALLQSLVRDPPR